MAGLPTNTRDQLMLLVGFLGIVGAGAYYMYPYSTKAGLLTEKVDHIERLDASNQKAKAMMARGTVQELQEESKRLQDNLAQMRTLIPTGNEVPALIDQVIGAARRAGLQFANFTPGGNVQGEQFETQRYRMSMDGNFGQIGSLLAEIGSLRRIVVPVNVSLSPVTGQAARAATDPANRLLRANFDIQTYVVRAAPPGGTP